MPTLLDHSDYSGLDLRGLADDQTGICKIAFTEYVFIAERSFSLTSATEHVQGTTPITLSLFMLQAV